MFRDLKEYQEIQKLYSEKVSKPEDLEENRNTRGSELAAKRLAEKPPVSEPKIKPTYQSNRDKMIQSRSANRPKSREEMELQLKYIDFLNEEIAKREMIELKKIQKELDDENEDKENQEVLQLIQMRRMNSTNFAELTC